jgi:extradiol dioxygenase family protein
MGIGSDVSPFHLAIPVWNLETCRKFYTENIGCKEGRSSDNWVDLNLFGHQLVLHYKPKEDSKAHCNEVDGKHVPVPHFGVILDWNVFEDFSKKLKLKEINFIIEPYVRFKGKVGEQATMFFLDPAGNALEFKAFKNKSQIFAK